MASSRLCNMAVAAAELPGHGALIARMYICWTLQAMTCIANTPEQWHGNVGTSITCPSS